MTDIIKAVKLIKENRQYYFRFQISEKSVKTITYESNGKIIFKDKLQIIEIKGSYQYVKCNLLSDEYLPTYHDRNSIIKVEYNDVSGRCQTKEFYITGKMNTSKSDDSDLIIEEITNRPIKIIDRVVLDKVNLYKYNHMKKYEIEIFIKGDVEARKQLQIRYYECNYNISRDDKVIIKISYEQIPENVQSDKNILSLHNNNEEKKYYIWRSQTLGVGSVEELNFEEIRRDEGVNTIANEGRVYPVKKNETPEDKIGELRKYNAKLENERDKLKQENKKNITEQAEKHKVEISNLKNEYDKKITVIETEKEKQRLEINKISGQLSYEKCVVEEYKIKCDELNKELKKCELEKQELREEKKRNRTIEELFGKIREKYDPESLSALFDNAELLAKFNSLARNRVKLLEEESELAERLFYFHNLYNWFHNGGNNWLAGVISAFKTNSTGIDAKVVGTLENQNKIICKIFEEYNEKLSGLICSDIDETQLKDEIKIQTYKILEKEECVEIFRGLANSLYSCRNVIGTEISKKNMISCIYYIQNM